MTRKDQYWMDHLAAIAAGNITTKAYAEREGLSAASLYYWRKRLKDTAAAAFKGPSSGKLVPVRLATSGPSDMGCTLTLGPGVYLELPQLPDPQWLACLVSATAEPVR